MATGAGFGCALDYADMISCWGSAPLLPGTEYLRLAAGPADICALTPSLDIECYGPSFSPGDVPAGSHQQVSRGDGFACGLLLDGQAVCWGTGFGTAGTATYRDLAGGGDHVCSLLSRPRR